MTELYRRGVTQGREYEDGPIHFTGPVRPMGAFTSGLFAGVQPTAPLPSPTLADLDEAIRQMILPKREALVHPDDEARVAEVLAAGNLSDLVNVTATKWVPPGTLYLYSPPPPEKTTQIMDSWISPDPIELADRFRFRMGVAYYGPPSPPGPAVTAPDRTRLRRIHSAYRRRKRGRW